MPALLFVLAMGAALAFFAGQREIDAQASAWRTGVAAEAGRLLWLAAAIESARCAGEPMRYPAYLPQGVNAAAIQDWQPRTIDGKVALVAGQTVFRAAAAKELAALGRLGQVSDMNGLLAVELRQRSCPAQANGEGEILLSDGTRLLTDTQKAVLADGTVVDLAFAPTQAVQLAGGAWHLADGSLVTGGRHRIVAGASGITIDGVFYACR